MNLTEIEGRVAALRESLEQDALDAIWDDSWALGCWGSQIRHEIDEVEGAYGYASLHSKARIAAITDMLTGEYACGNL